LNTTSRKKALYNDGLSPVDDFRRTKPIPATNLFCEEPSDDDDVKSTRKKTAAIVIDFSDSENETEDFKTPFPPPSKL
jgi:hypothetical protein